jgi:hypothetical protein
MQFCSDIQIYNHIMIWEESKREDAASALDYRNNYVEQTFLAPGFSNFERCRPAGQFLPALTAPTGRPLCWPSHGCHCLQPVISGCWPRTLSLEHETSSFASGPARAGAVLSSQSLSLTGRLPGFGRRERGLQLWQVQVFFL